MPTGRPHHYGHLLSFQPLTLYTSIHDLINVYSRRSGADNPRGQNVYENRNLLSLRSFATSFKKNSLKADFIHLFSWFYTCIQPQRRGYNRGYNRLGTKFWCQQEHLVTSVICCKFQRNLFEVWFYTFFHYFIHVYSPRAGADGPKGTKFWCQQKCLVALFICCKFKKHLFEVWLYTIFFMILCMSIAPGQGQTTPMGQSFDVNRNVLSLHSFVASLKKSVFEVWFYTMFSWFNTCI